MPTIDYSPRLVPVDQLDSAIELDTVFVVNEDGTVELAGELAPEVTGHLGKDDPTIADRPGAWEFFSRGYTGQHGYSGPEMHSSEFLGGRLAADVLADPGTYALVGVRYDCGPEVCDREDPIDENGECIDAPHIESWAVLKAADRPHSGPDPEEG